MNATLETIDGRPALRFERHLHNRVERVWRALVVPAELARWLPAAVEWTPTVGEAFEAGGQTGQVTELDPPHAIAWTFGGQRYRFDLRPEGTGCVLTFLHVFDDGASAAQTAAGWECYLDRLDVLLTGEDLSEQQAHQPTGERHERYAARFGVDPGPGRQFIATAMGFRGLTLAPGPVLRLERHYDHPVERMWRALTDPGELAHWFPGGLDVIEQDPPHRLVGSWQGEGALRFELRPDRKGCTLLFTHEFSARHQAALAAAGWDRSFARLDALAAGHPMNEPDSLASWLEVHDRLAAEWGIDPAIGHGVYAERGAG